MTVTGAFSSESLTIDEIRKLQSQVTFITNLRQIIVIHYKVNRIPPYCAFGPSGYKDFHANSV